MKTRPTTSFFFAPPPQRALQQSSKLSRPSGGSFFKLDAFFPNIPTRGAPYNPQFHSSERLQPPASTERIGMTITESTPPVFSIPFLRRSLPAPRPKNVRLKTLGKSQNSLGTAKSFWAYPSFVFPIRTAFSLAFTKPKLLFSRPINVDPFVSTHRLNPSLLLLLKIYFPLPPEGPEAFKQGLSTNLS